MCTVSNRELNSRNKLVSLGKELESYIDENIGIFFLVISIYLKWETSNNNDIEIQEPTYNDLVDQFFSFLKKGDIFILFSRN